MSKNNLKNFEIQLEIEKIKFEIQELKQKTGNHNSEIFELKKKLEEMIKKQEDDKLEIIKEIKETQNISIENKTTIKNTFKFFTLFISIIILIINIFNHFEVIKKWIGL